MNKRDSPCARLPQTAVHSPGPLRAIAPVRRQHWRVTLADFTTLAFVCGPGRAENAALFAAAPQLLEACILARNEFAACSRDCMGTPSFEYFRALADKLDAAIVIATNAGRSGARRAGGAPPQAAPIEPESVEARAAGENKTR